MKDNRFQNAGIGINIKAKTSSTHTKFVPFDSTLMLMLISSQLPSLYPPLQSSCILINLPRTPRRISHLSAYWQLKWKNCTTLKVSNNQRTKHFQPDYDVFVDVASCWYCFSSAFFSLFDCDKEGWTPESVFVVESSWVWPECPAGPAPRDTSSASARRGDSREEKEGRIWKMQGLSAPSASSGTMALRNLMRSLVQVHLRDML